MFKKIMVLFVLITSIMYPQSWNDIKTTNINVTNANAEMFSNSFGNNVIIQNSNGSITYYLVNASTGLAGSAITVESSGASLAQIAGEAEKVYVLYRKNNKIVGKYSVNSGSTWIPIAELNVTPTSLDAVAYDGKIHIAYSSNNITYYYQYFNGSWTGLFNVSNSATGTNPRIEMLTTQNKVYVVFNSSSGSAKSRELTLPSTWASVQTLHSNVNYSNVAGFGVDANYLYLYYSEVSEVPSWHNNLVVRKIQKSNYQTVSLSYEFYNPTDYLQTTTTVDNKVHTAFTWYGATSTGYESFPLEPGLVHDFYNNGTRDAENVEVNYNYEQYYNVEISSTSNDLFILWKQANSSIMKYRQYDAVPLAPQNLTVTKSSANHPLLSWTKNNEADLQNYKIYKYSYAELGWQYYGSSTTNSFEDLNETYVTGGAVANEHWVYYKVTAVDMHPYESPASNQIGARVKGAGLEKIAGSIPNEYSLDQNYPNPFNPSTRISYSIKEEGLVKLKVYDILGKEIATLVNENKPAGNYEVDFNASQLPSGMYIYKIQSGQFSDVKKMLLTK